MEDIGSPGKARALGKVAEVYPDGTRLLELQRPENGTFGFRISAGNGRPDSGEQKPRDTLVSINCQDRNVGAAVSDSFVKKIPGCHPSLIHHLAIDLL